MFKIVRNVVSGISDDSVAAYAEAADQTEYEPARPPQVGMVVDMAETNWGGGLLPGNLLADIHIFMFTVAILKNAKRVAFCYRL